ncbi:MAG: hypothetical protein K2O05_04455 [Anaeroplasmataceae bacterium]|nr:hypothetical protein [Anaeroplasmataceae bacterium]
MRDEIEKAINDSFKELFINNYIWLIVLVFFIGIVLLLYILIHSNGTATYRRELEMAVKELKLRVKTLEKNNVANTTAVQSPIVQTTLDDIARQLNDLKNEIKK